MHGNSQYSLRTRRVEDKADAKTLVSLRINIRMQPAHGNRRIPLVYPAWIMVSDSASKNVFSQSRLVVAEYLASIVHVMFNGDSCIPSRYTIDPHLRCNRNDISWLPLREYKVPRQKNSAPCTTEAAERSSSGMICCHIWPVFVCFNLRSI